MSIFKHIFEIAIIGLLTILSVSCFSSDFHRIYIGPKIQNEDLAFIVIKFPQFGKCDFKIFEEVEGEYNQLIESSWSWFYQNQPKNIFTTEDDPYFREKTKTEGEPGNN